MGVTGVEKMDLKGIEGRIVYNHIKGAPYMQSVDVLYQTITPTITPTSEPRIAHTTEITRTPSSAVSMPRRNRLNMKIDLTSMVKTV